MSLQNRQDICKDVNRRTVSRMSNCALLIEINTTLAAVVGSRSTRRMVNSPSESEVISPTSRVTLLSLSDLLTTACDRFPTTSAARVWQTHTTWKPAIVCVICVWECQLSHRRVDHEPGYPSLGCRRRYRNAFDTSLFICRKIKATKCRKLYSSCKTACQP